MYNRLLNEHLVVQDTLIRCDQMFFCSIFNNFMRSRHVFHRCCNAWILLAISS